MNHFVRSTQYGEVFRTTTSVGGVEKIRDVLRVSIPFNPKREALLRDKMGDDTNDFYKKFARCVSNDIKIRRYLGTLDASGDDRTAVENLKASNLTISANHQLKHEGVPGSDIYLISDVAEPFVGSTFFSGYAFTMTNLAMFAARAAQIIKGLDTYHVHLGAIDLDSIVLRTKDDGKQLFAFSSFLYGGFDEGYEPKDKAGQPWRVNSFPATVPVTMDENIRNGEERPSLVGDMHSLAALLWVILCGDDYRNAPNWDLTPQYAPDRTAQLLKEVYASDDPEMLKALQKEFRGIARNISSESDAEDADTLPDADTCSEEEIIESEAFKTVYEHAIAGGMSKDDAYTEAYAAALQEISPFAVRIGFVNPDTGSDDETEFDVNSIFEALNLFRNDFREDNHWKEMPKILYIESDK